jgi:biotin-(acetyl-CoA carboxylase) ligase
VLTDICEQIQSQGIAIKPERNAVASALLCKVVSACQSFSQTPEAGLKKFRASYDFCRHKKVEVTQDNGEVLVGVAQGVNKNAELLVLAAGELRAFNSAEVSVRADEAVAMR